MATNHYFNNFGTNTADQRLVENIIIESIQVYGIDVHYMPRTQVNTDAIFGEDRLSQFKDARTIEMYIKSVDGFEGEGTFVSNFGLEVRDQITFTVAKRRFQEMNFESDGRDIEPKSGDIIYFPLSGSLFEILDVQGTNTFYQTGSLQTFDLVCELFKYSDEALDTGIETIDKIEIDKSYAIEFTMGAGSSNYTIEETVYQGATFGSATATGEVAAWNSTTKILKLINLTGTFSTSSNIIGNSSGASYAVTTFDSQAQPTDPSANNVGIESAADSIIDFSEGNPFSEGTNY
jgi:hypothetical protein|tara:strand:+ start:983 stop:1855 length:873 start_codon:yes stop_codon:yes gene_type:complete